MCDKGYYSSNSKLRLVQGLKEWATVVKALEEGNQTIILRKGGILETASGFNIESKKFFLFPTYEHQEKKHIKSKFHDYLSKALGQKPEDGFNVITSIAEVLDEVDVLSDEKLKSLSEFHIWSDEYIDARKNWMPDKPIKAVFLQVTKIAPLKIPIKSEYQGCKSWIEINDNDRSGDLALSKTELDSQLKKFREIVN